MPCMMSCLEHDPYVDLVPPRLRLTPRHYAYLKISEGCNNRCSFCIIPSLRGDLANRPPTRCCRGRAAGEGGRQGIARHQPGYERLRARYQVCGERVEGRQIKAKFYDLAAELGQLGAWVRLRYVYPYPHVDDVIG